MHIFFILRGRSRAKLSSLFQVRISRSVTALWTCLGHPFLTRGYAKRRNGFLLGLRYANVSLAHSGVESS